MIVDLLIDGRNTEMGKLFAFSDTIFSVTAFVNVYVFGQSPKILQLVENKFDPLKRIMTIFCLSNIFSTKRLQC